jgi:hypothetical protein
MDTNFNRVNEDTERAAQQAGAQLASIEDLVACLEHAESCDDSACGADCPHEPDEARHAILDDPLAVEVRGAWHTPGALDDANQPYSARLQYQDWFTEWTNYALTDAEEETLITYAQQFSFDL